MQGRCRGLRLRLAAINAVLDAETDCLGHTMVPQWLNAGQLIADVPKKRSLSQAH